MKSPRRSEQGFSLVEVLVSMMILAIGLMAVASMQINAGRMDIRSMGMTEGGALAHGKMEELIGRPYEHGDLSAGAHPIQVREEYSLAWSVADSTPIPNVKTVTVTVTWNETGLAKRYQLSYLKPAGI
jgi:prepilin-type N-terminal cleavage/methylation domain-containing protein